MRYSLALLALMLVPLGLADWARADVFNPAAVPADAKWVIHVDMDAVRKSKSWDRLSPRLLANPGVADGISKAEAITGLRFPDDLHDVTLYGRSIGQAAGVVLIHADFDQDRILGLLQLNAAYTSTDYGSYQILSWHDDDKDQTMYGAFHGKSLAIIAQSQELVQTALDTLDKKSDAPKPDSTLASGSAPGALLYVAASDVWQLKKDDKAQSPIIQQMDSAWISLGEDQSNLVLKASVTARSVESARQMCRALEGIRALVILSGSGDRAAPKAKALADAVGNLTCKMDGKLVNVEWPVSVDLANSLLDRVPTTQENSTQDQKQP